LEFLFYFSETGLTDIFMVVSKNYMNKLKFTTITISLLLLFCFNKIEAKIYLTLKFKVVNNAIILKVETKSDKFANILFDSGSNTYFIDSAFAKGSNSIRIDSKNFGVTFTNGNLKAFAITNLGFFKDSAINKFYINGESLNLKKLSKHFHTRIDGLFGINRLFKNYIVILDFENGLFKIVDNEEDISKKTNYNTLNMIYTDGSLEEDHINPLKHINACRASIAFNNHFQINTNVLFDSGFNKELALLTTLNIDSLIKNTNNTITIKKNRLVNMSDSKSDLYYFKVDTVTLDDKVNMFNTKISLANTPEGNMAGYGDLKIYGLVGVTFLKKHKKVYFDYINMKIGLEN
jgi:hypothetical protein